MEKTLDQELENAFLSLDEKAVKSLLAAGADKNGRIRNKMLIRSMSEPPHLHNILPTDSDQEKKRTKKWNQEELKEAKKNLAVIKLLLANGANPNWVDPNPSWYNTCLMESLELGNCKKHNCWLTMVQKSICVIMMTHRLHILHTTSPVAVFGQ